MARVQGTGNAWLFPFVDGHPPIGWHDAIAYLVLPVLLVISQVSQRPSVLGFRVLCSPIPILCCLFSDTRRSKE